MPKKLKILINGDICIDWLQFPTKPKDSGRNWKFYPRTPMITRPSGAFLSDRVIQKIKAGGTIIGIIKKLFEWSNKKKETERTSDKIERTQNTLKTGQKAEPTEFIQPSQTKNNIKTTKRDKVHVRPAATKDRQIRVFISSTFRDMQDERDILIKKIFPQLRKL